jgi:hypothetical protein
MSEELFQNQRFQTFLTTDKPIYKLCDTVYIRTVVLNQEDQSPGIINFFNNFK